MKKSITRVMARNLITGDRMKLNGQRDAMIVGTSTVYNSKSRAYGITNLVIRRANGKYMTKMVSPDTRILISETSSMKNLRRKMSRLANRSNEKVLKV